MILSLQQHRLPSNWQRPTAMLIANLLAVLLVGSSDVQASCGDYLHADSASFNTTLQRTPLQTTTRPTPQQTPQQTPCQHGRCDRSPSPIPVPTAPAPNKTSDNLTVVAQPHHGHEPDPLCQVAHADQLHARSGHHSRIDRPPRR
jgi:hypothetical protein